MTVRRIRRKSEPKEEEQIELSLCVEDETSVSFRQHLTNSTRRDEQVANKAILIAALDAPIASGERPRRLGAGGVNYSEWGQGQRYDTTMYEIQRSRKRRRDVKEDQFNVQK
jgi:hypothetical protein